MRKIAVVTGTRAEFGIMRHILQQIRSDAELQLQLLVTGAHLLPQYGMTVDEIREAGFDIDEELDIVFASNSRQAAARSAGIACMEFADAFQRLKPDILLVLGDRYEIFAAVSAAMLMNIPIAHISGGEVTEGAQDEQMRHAITKMAHIHFAGAEAYADNIRKMGEESWRINLVGEPGLENIRKMNFLSVELLKEKYKIEVDKDTLLVTFHPVTLELEQLSDHFQNLLSALEKIQKRVIFTYPNADAGSQYIIEELLKFKEHNDNVYVFENLGSELYLNVMKLCGAVVGNSSSAIIEAPFLKVPVVDIGNRQKGRLKAANIIECGYSEEEIKMSIDKALSREFAERCTNTSSLYGDGETSIKIAEILKNVPLGEKLLKKRLSWS